jgi:hypothetical protein
MEKIVDWKAAKIGDLITYAGKEYCVVGADIDLGLQVKILRVVKTNPKFGITRVRELWV